MSTRTTSKTVHSTVPTEAQMRSAMDGYITAHLAIERINNAAATETERIKVAADTEAKPHTDSKALHETTLMRYADAHPELFEKRQKTEVYGGHKIGWQISPPAVTLVRAVGEKRKQTWDGFVAACKRIGNKALDYIRTIEEPNKGEILSLHAMFRTVVAENPDDAPKLQAFENELATLGVAVTQQERFVIDLNLQPVAAEPT